MRNLAAILSALSLAVAVQPTMAYRPIDPRKTADPAAPMTTGCSRDGLVHGEVSVAITQRVAAAVTLLDKSARLRDVSKLTLPCGFSIDPRWSANLFLTNGKETRRYFENNPFGFSMPFGPGDQASGSFTLQYRTVDANAQPAGACAGTLAKYTTGFDACASFGSPNAFFAARRHSGRYLLAHYVVDGASARQDFAVADSRFAVRTLVFLPPPDAPGGTITLILADHGDLYRAFLDVSRG